MRLPSAPPSTSASAIDEHAVGRAAQHADEHDRDDDRADREDRRDALEAAERAAAVARQAELDGVADDVLRPVGERGDRPALRQPDRSRRSPRSRRPPSPCGAPSSARRVRRRRPRSTAPLATGLALHALHGPREHLEPRERDAIAARDAEAEGVRRTSARSARSMSSTVWRAVADSARSRSRSTFTVSPSPDSSSNWVSPCSRSLASRSASAASSSAWRRWRVALGLEPLPQLLERARRERRRQLLLGRRLRRGRRLDRRRP